jgi:putative tricarboxylic transport membrane protein
VGNVIGLFIVLAFTPLFVAVLKIRFAVLMPAIVYVCAIGAYAVNNRMIDIYYMIIFGVPGYVGPAKEGIPRARVSRESRQP